MHSMSIMIYLRSPGKMSLWTPGHFRPDLLTAFYILLTISFRFPCIFFNYDLLTNMCYGLAYYLYTHPHFHLLWLSIGFYSVVISPNIFSSVCSTQRYLEKQKRKLISHSPYDWRIILDLITTALYEVLHFSEIFFSPVVF